MLGSLHCGLKTNHRNVRFFKRTIRQLFKRKKRKSFGFIYEIDRRIDTNCNERDNYDRCGYHFATSTIVSSLTYTTMITFTTVGSSQSS